LSLDGSTAEIILALVLLVLHNDFLAPSLNEDTFKQ